MNIFALGALLCSFVALALFVDIVWRARTAALNAKWQVYHTAAVDRMDAELRALRAELQGGAK